MSEIFPMFLKANIKGHGYIYKWSDEYSPPIDEESLDKVLPVMDSSKSNSIAYAVTRLSPNLLIIVVGVHWENQSDEFKRDGLSYWHGVLVDVGKGDYENLWQLSNILLGMLQRFDVGYNNYGELVGDLAKKKQDLNWESSLFHLMRNVQPSINDFEKKLALSFMERGKELRSKINLQVNFPFHPLVAVPCVLSMILFDSKIRRVGGGSLLISRSKDFQVLAVQEEVKNFRNLVINDLLRASLDLDNQNAKRINDAADSRTINLKQMVTGIIFILVIITLCVLIYLAISDISWLKR